ncbi:MAG TPA: penicillin acylase family protein [Acidobacteriaceae bacterium]|nr:penicillin acylase family protein [Acidobacteriaceae bacterium]
MSLTGDAAGSTRDREENRLAAVRLEADDEPRLLTREDIDRSHRETSSRPPRRRRVFRGVLIALTLLVIIAVGLTIAGTIWARHVMRAALPVVDGTISVTGLHGPVTVTRNAQGVPSIRATSEDDLLFAQGYVTAQDRLWQMDTLRRHAAGELAEILGPGMVEHDKLQRYLRLRAAADRGAASLPEDQRRELEAYARGVNAFIDSHRDNLPLEFHLLHYAPRPWTPRDSLLVSLVMWQDLSTSFTTKLDREALARHLPASLLPDLYPVGSWRDHAPTQPPTDLTTPHEIEEIPLDKTQSRVDRPVLPASAGDLVALTAALDPAGCEDCRSGSNNWAVSGAHSTSGKPLVSNDMHLGLRVPDIWYEAALHLAANGSAPIDVAGFTLPGLPWVVVGRNTHVAWSFTNLGGDVQDVRVEHFRGSGSDMQFEQPDGTWSPVQHHTEQIVVRGGPNVSLDVLTVQHAAGTGMMESPIISPAIPSEHRMLSLAWAIYDPACVDNSMFATNTASAGASLVASLASFGGPSLNLIYGDDQGHIGYHAIGRIPIRGPAVQHPRVQQQFVLPSPEPESEEEEDSEPPSPPVTQAPQKQQPQPHPKTGGSQPQIALEPTQSYTIGSPILMSPVDALDASQMWSGYVPYNELPSIQDPAAGIVATANARITPDDYPYALADDWVDPYRVERIYRLLDARSAWKPEQMLHVEIDQHSEFDLVLAHRLAYAIDHSSAKTRSSDSQRLQQAADLLRTWNGEMSAGSPAAAIVAATRGDLWSALLVPQIIAHDGGSRTDAARISRLYTWHEDNTALEDLLEHMPARWLPRGVANWSDFLTSVVEQGLHDAHAPRNLAGWQYGSIHPIVIDHPLFAGRPYLNWLLGTATGSGAQPAGGDMTTIDAIGPSFGPSERYTADLSDPSAALANIVTGESGNLSSPWYLDQLQPWLRGTTFALPVQSDNAEHSLTLIPSH